MSDVSRPWLSAADIADEGLKWNQPRSTVFSRVKP